MKKLLPVLVLSLVLLQLVLLPAAVSANGFGQATVATLAASNITPNSATLNASINVTAVGSNRNSGLRPVSDTPGYDFANIPITLTGYFRYGTSSGALSYSTLPVNVPYGATSFNTGVMGLYPCTAYYVQAVLVYTIHNSDYQPSPSGYMIALFSRGNSLTGLGIGLDQLIERSLHTESSQTTTVSGNIVGFSTIGCVIPPGSHGTGTMGFNGGPVGISNITVQTAAISASKVGPGEKVDITATVANKGAVNGATSVTLYINGQLVESKGITLASGQSEPVHFFVSQNEPGTYNVQVGGVSAGSFTVDSFSNNNILIYGLIALFTLGIAGTLFMLTRKRSV
jgi:hypothetical protein